ncbi:MAG: CPBP family intramembrane glutamic endopeptidase [Thermofilaceae archaeon]
MVAAVRGALERCEGGSTNVWLPYLAFIVLANFASPELSYLQLAAFSAYILSKTGAASNRSTPTYRTLPLFALAQLPLALAGGRSQPSMLALLSSVIAAVVEELYFRGVLQPRLGIVPQAFAFALAHLRLTDPVSLVESALIFPHFMLLGIALGIVADQGGYLSSAAAHAVYNAVSAFYTLPFDMGAVAALLAIDAALASILAGQRWVRR